MESNVINLSLLGSWQITTANGKSSREPRQKVKALMAYLALESSQTHSRALLTALFWPEMSKEEGRNNLRVTLSQLKKLVEHPDLIKSSRTEVAFNTAVSHNIDVLQFETLVKQTEQHDHPSLAQCETCLADLETAVSLYRGDFLVELVLNECEAFEEWQFVWRERLHVMMLRQLDRLAQGMMENGRYAQAELHARRQIKLDALDESGHRNVMRALYAQGQRTTALQQYQSCVEVLSTELGVSPDAETEHLKTEIEQSHLDTQTRFEQKRQPAVHPTNLPDNLTPFFGREEELTLLSERIKQRSYRLISLVGPGGIGKTRLSIEAGRQQLDSFADGVYFVSLVGVHSAHNVPSAVAEAIGFILDPSEASPAEQIGNYLAERETLLIIDNLEHLMDEVADILLDWLNNTKNLVLLVTSRERINVQIEDLFRLKGLPYPADRTDSMASRYEAVRLFGDRAHRLNKQFWLNEDTLADVVHICQLVEGLPLALELAATSIRDYTAAEIANLLSEQPDLLETDLRDIPARHRRIEAVFDFSWQLLSDAEKELLPKLAVFQGGFTKEAARQIAGASPLTLTRLRYKSLIRADGNGRFSMHELLRQIAEKKLRQKPQDWQTVQQNYARTFLEFVQSESSKLVTVDAAQAANLLRIDLDNIRAAWETAVQTGESQTLQKTAAGLVDFYLHIGFGYEIEHVLSYVESAYLAQHRSVPIDLQLYLDLLKLDLPSLRDNPTVFKPLFDSFLARLENWSHQDKKLFEAKAHFYASTNLGSGKDAQNMSDRVDKALQLAYQAEDKAHLGEVLCTHARVKYRYKQFDAAILALNEAMALFEQLGHLKGMAMVEEKLAPAIAEGGNPWEAVKHDLKSLELFQQLGDEKNIPRGHFNAYLSYVTFGAYEKAYWHAKQCAALYKKMGDESGFFLGISGMADVEMMWGNYDTSLELFEQCLAFRKQNEEYERFCFEGLDVGRCLEMAGRYADGLSLMDEIIQWLEKFEYSSDIVVSNVVKALLLFKKGEEEAGLALAEKLYNQIEWDNVTEPLKTAYELFTVFDQANHPFAKEVIQRAHEFISKVASKITDPEMNTSYLHHVPYCRWLGEKFERYGIPVINALQQKNHWAT